MEGRTRALEEGASAAGVGERGGGRVRDSGAAGMDGLAQARVALALKSAAARRQRDLVKTMQSEVFYHVYSTRLGMILMN